MNALHYFFHIYDGAVWSNLIASLICFFVAALFAHFHLKLLHNRLSDQDAQIALLHSHLCQIKALLQDGKATHD